MALFTAIAAGGAESDVASARFRTTTKRADDRVDVNAEKDRTVFTVHSPFGISHAVIERVAETWPDAVVVRMRLKGLEGFRTSNGRVTLEAAVSSGEGPPKVRLWKDGQEDKPLDAKSPFWMDVRMLGADGSPAETIPLQNGCFELPLPKALFEGNPRSITLSWIDFHRN